MAGAEHAEDGATDLAGHPGDERVLVLTGKPRDTAITIELLAAQGILAEASTDVAAVAAALDGAGAALLAEEVLGAEPLRILTAALGRQPPWSDFPFVIVGGGRAPEGGEAPLVALANVAVLDRPVRTRTMLAAVRSALRARRRQYAARREIRSRDQFLAMLGHELRNPLAAIAVAAELLGRAPDEDARWRHRAVIERHALHLGRLVDDLLDVSRVTHGKVRLELRPVDLGEVLRGCAQTFEHVASARGVEIAIVAPEPTWITGDRLRLEQIASNLLGNALKFTPRGGHVWASVARADGGVELRVVDDGNGIESDVLPHVFDLFAQGRQGPERAAGGMGLGLTLVHRLVELHGGEVTVRSEGVGRGSELVVRLPGAAAPASAAAAERRAPRHEGPRRVVVVEDSDDIRELFEELLRASGHEVETGVDGPHGVEVILGRRPDVAFVDVGLPGFDGYEVARRVRAELGSEVVLVAMTGYGQADDRARARSAGFDHHLTKPVDVRALEALVACATRAPAARAVSR